MKTLALFLLLGLNCSAQFAQPALKAQLRYGQKVQEFTFIADSKIDDATANCDCTTLKLDGNKIHATVDTTSFLDDTERSIDVEMEDGRECRIWMHFDVPQPVAFSQKSLIWERNAPASPITLNMSIPQGSPVKKLLEAGLSGKNFDMKTKTVKEGAEYQIEITPLSTGKKVLERLVIKTESSDIKSSQYIIYLRVK